MAIIKLGLTKDAIDSAKDTYDGPRQAFPATKIGYTKYTGIVTDLEIKEGKDRNAGKAWLWIQVSNGPCQESILVNLDPSDVAPTTPPDKVEAAVKRNLDTLTRALKVLDLADANGDLDTNRMVSAAGTIISFGVKLGDMQANGYPKYYVSFYGKAETLVPVNVGVPLGGVASGGSIDDSIPF